MKQQLQNLLSNAIKKLQADNKLAANLTPQILVERTRDKQHGDFTSNIALTLAKAADLKPRDLAQLIVDQLSSATELDHAEIAGPGFINFYLTTAAAQSVINTILAAGANYGASTIGIGKKVNIEFVSANPTGPLHVGH
ncbi:MAG: arginine--tRNA ligase, partial [Gammaproteobacteria bacterium]|nr:arginine--tRNA ligase [Gammaproteobacteria bacterium]